MRVFIRSTLIGLSLVFLSSVFTSQAAAEEYYIYRNEKGAVVLTNQEPPDNSMIIKQMTIPDQAQVPPQAESEERSSNIPADDLAPRMNWVWAWSI